MLVLQGVGVIPFRQWENNMRRSKILIIVVVCAIVLTGIAVWGWTQSLGAELPFVEHGTLFTSRPGDGVGITMRTRAKNVGRVTDGAADHVLYIASAQGKNAEAIDGSLWLVDIARGVSWHIARGVVSARLSPDRQSIVLWRRNDVISIVSAADGREKQRIGVHGAAPIFSHDGNLVAYMKLPDHAPERGFAPSIPGLGIAVYDLRTNRETLVTRDGNADDFAPVGFSADFTQLYFHSTRPYDGDPGNHVASLWVADLVHGGIQRLTNLTPTIGEDVVPLIHPDALWSSDRSMIVSAAGERGIWMYKLSADGMKVDARHIADGSEPQWLVQDRRIVFRTTSNGESVWRLLDIDPSGMPQER